MPLVNLDCVAHQLPPRPVRHHPNTKGPCGVRLGPNASGAMSQWMQEPRLMPSAFRKASPREITNLLQNPQRLGYPSTMNADACLGFSVYSYQSWGIAYGLCEAGLFNLARLPGPISMGRDAPTHSPAQQGKVVFCPCCVAATHVAIPATYRSGPVGSLKRSGSCICAE